MGAEMTLGERNRLGHDMGVAKVSLAMVFGVGGPSWTPIFHTPPGIDTDATTTTGDPLTGGVIRKMARAPVLYPNGDPMFAVPMRWFFYTRDTTTPLKEGDSLVSARDATLAFQIIEVNRAEPGYLECVLEEA